MSFNLTSLIPGVGEKYEFVATNAIVVTGLIVAGFAAKSSLKKQGANAVIPDGQVSLKTFFETITEFIQGLVDMVIGEHGRKFIPMFASIFTFVFINNLISVIPGMSPATVRRGSIS